MRRSPAVAAALAAALSLAACGSSAPAPPPATTTLPTTTVAPSTTTTAAPTTTTFDPKAAGPCRPGEVKVDRNSGRYYLPTDPGYAGVLAVATICLPTAEVAMKEGFKPA